MPCAVPISVGMLREIIDPPAVTSQKRELMQILKGSRLLLNVADQRRRRK